MSDIPRATQIQGTNYPKSANPYQVHAITRTTFELEGYRTNADTIKKDHLEQCGIKKDRLERYGIDHAGSASGLDQTCLSYFLPAAEALHEMENWPLNLA